MAARSAGILMYQRKAGELLVLLVHPGGPFWRHRDTGAWSIPKGELNPGEDPEQAARREFAEELGAMPKGPLQALGQIRQSGGKLVDAFAVEGELDVTAISSEAFKIEWPPRSRRIQSFPEVDRATWFTLPVARQKILAGQRPFLDELETLLSNEKSR